MYTQFQIPLVPSIVLSVDILNKRLKISPPSGLLDLTYEEKRKKQAIRGFLPSHVTMSPLARKELELVSKVVNIQKTYNNIVNSKSKKKNVVYQEGEEDIAENSVNITKLEFLMEQSEREKDIFNKYY